MARQPRFALTGQPQHVIQRANNRDVAFAEPDDYHFYPDTLGAACVGWWNTKARTMSTLAAMNAIIMTSRISFVPSPLIETPTCFFAMSITAARLAVLGRDLETRVLARTVGLHLDHRIWIDQGRTIIFE